MENLLYIFNLSGVNIFIGVKNILRADGEQISTALSYPMTERFQELDMDGTTYSHG